MWWDYSQWRPHVQDIRTWTKPKSARVLWWASFLLRSEDGSLLFKQVHMMMHLLIRDQKDGILCPIPSHSLYTSYMVLQGATLVCTAVTRNRKKKATAVTYYYAIPIFLWAKHIYFLRCHITLTNPEAGEWACQIWRSSWMVPDQWVSLWGDLWL